MTDDTGDDGRLIVDRVAGLRRLLPGVVRRNYLVKFGVAILFVFVLISGAGLLTIEQTTDTLDQQVSQQLTTDTDSEVAGLRSWREQRSRWLTELSKTRALQREQAEPVSISLQQTAKTTAKDVRFVHVINLSSTEILASSERRMEGAVLAERGVTGLGETTFEKASDVFVSAVYRDEGLPAVAYVTPVPERPDRAAVAVTRAQSPLSDGAETPNDRFVTVIDETRTIVMDSRGDEFVGQQYARDDSTALFDRLASGGSGFLRESPNQAQLDRQHVAAYATMDQPQWVVVTHVPEEEAYLIRQNIISDLTQLLVVSLVGLTLIGLVIAGGTVNSINRLATRVDELEAGNLDVELSTSREDEIGQLYDGFDSMRDSLQNRITELSEAVTAEEQMRKQLSEINDELENQRVIISVLNRLLRHNLRNSLTSILLHTQQLSGDVRAEKQDNVDGIITTSERLLRRVEKSRRIEQIIGTDSADLQAVNVGESVAESVDLHGDEYPAASISATLTDETYARVGRAIGFIIDNLLENAIEHNDRDDPSVDVQVRSVHRDGARWVELTVEDDGPGIPDVETEVLGEGEETPLEHGSGVGLWLVNWLIDHVGGELRFEENDPRGTRAVVWFPEVDPSETQSDGEGGASTGHS